MQVISSKKMFLTVVAIVTVLGCSFVTGFSSISIIIWVLVGIVAALILGKLTDEDWGSDDLEDESASGSNVQSGVDDEKARETGSATAETAAASDSSGGDAGGGGGGGGDAGM
ncbi:hypothetical protein [Ruegeria sp. 6PALISEP08]|uniref:hypothetical protein n=1 Tax=Ruegeria sp. 6PALISEP08 TaxID=1225660 RepID=UPI000AC269BD|nr:hypothetical protein [Ruegeria sp. 6PALISEP08]